MRSRRGAIAISNPFQPVVKVLAEVAAFHGFPQVAGKPHDAPSSSLLPFASNLVAKEPQTSIRPVKKVDLVACELETAQAEFDDRTQHAGAELASSQLREQNAVIPTVR